jgi:hypothetical protein
MLLELLSFFICNNLEDVSIMLMSLLHSRITLGWLGIKFVLFGQLYLVFVIILSALLDAVEIVQGRATHWTWGERKKSVHFK